MDYRRYYGLRPPRSLGGSTFMAPQLENYSLFSNPYLALKGNTDIFVQKSEQVASSQSEKGAKSKLRGKPKQEDVPKDVSSVEESFGIVLNVATVNPDELNITLGKGNEVEVHVKQTDICLKYEDMTFSRNCYYRYQLPDGVDKDTLVALRTSDDYLIILPRGQLREDLLKKSIKLAKAAEKPSDKDSASASKSTGSGSKGEKMEEGKDSKSEEPELVFRDGNHPIPIEVSRILRSGMDIFLLRKYMNDLECYVSTVRKFIENSSFVTANSKTAERGIIHKALKDTESFFEDEKLARKLSKGLSLESGYTTSNPSSENVSEDSTDSAKSPMVVDASGESGDSESR